MGGTGLEPPTVSACDSKGLEESESSSAAKSGAPDHKKRCTPLRFAGRRGRLADAAGRRESGHPGDGAGRWRGGYGQR
jgi:hypothetical protein